MYEFASTREAKEFAILQIVEQAAREGTPLDDIERKTLYFTETAWSLPDMWEVQATFDESYVQSEYENKIADLIQNYLKWARRHDTSSLERWKAAIKALKHEDHYFLVMLDDPGSKSYGQSWPRIMKLVVIIGIPFFIAIFLLTYWFGSHL